jgi:predicted DNA-binding transcriptional regulator AlpA
MDFERSGSYMERIKLTALRDFAIEHLPRAQQTRSKSHAGEDDYHRALFGLAVLTLTTPKSSAIEQTAAHLLKVVTSLVVAWDEYCSQTPHIQSENDAQVMSSALELSMLTGISLPFLSAPNPTDRSAPPDEPETPQLQAAPSHSREHTTGLPPLTPGRVLTTQEAADYLRMKVQTLHKWASSDSGPVTPIKIGKRRLGWHSADILRVINGQ